VSDPTTSTDVGTEPKVFFVHVQKAAGTSLIYRLRRIFDRSEIYPDASDGAPEFHGSVISVDHLRARWPLRRTRAHILTGHFPLRSAELLEEQFRTLTTLRDPVERTLSYLRHHRVMTPSDAERPLEELYEDPDRFARFIHNHMVKMFSLAADEMEGGGMLTEVDFTPAHLERAKQRLATVDVLGTQEAFGSFCAELTRRFGWELGPPLWANRTQPEDFDPAFVEQIRRDNALDIELYRHAVELVESRSATSSDQAS
jgi:hypothetical protein